MSKPFINSVWLLAACGILFPQANWAQREKSSSSPADPLPANSVWTDVTEGLTLTVLERKGENFRGKLVAADSVERTFTGTVKGNKVAWLAKDVQAAKGGQGGDNTGIINGDRIDFEYSTNSGKGAFTLRRSDVPASQKESKKGSTTPLALNDSTFEHWRDYILPKAKETAYLEIPWQTSFFSAVNKARKTNRPILLWTMNGHPLGCT